VRELTVSELRFVFGGIEGNGSDPDPTLDPIVVNPPYIPPMPPPPATETPPPPTPPGDSGSPGSPTDPGDAGSSPDVTSGLGEAVDDYINEDEELKALLKKYLDAGLTPIFGDTGGNFGERQGDQVVISSNLQGGSLEVAAVLMHELYHWDNRVAWYSGTPSEQQYVDAWLRNEASALIAEIGFVMRVEPTSSASYPSDPYVSTTKIGSTLTYDEAVSEIAQWYGNQPRADGMTTAEYYRSVYNGGTP
jgi:hypothetical protein